MNFLIPNPAATKPGVYAIRTSLDGRLYIGSTQSFRKRFTQHRTELKRGTHHATRLQALVNEHGLDVLSFHLLELALPGQDLRELEQRHLDLHLPADPARGFNNLPTAWGHAPAQAEQKVILPLTPELLAQLDQLQPGSGMGTRLAFLRTLLHSAVQQLRAKRDGGLLSVEVQAGEASKFEALAEERNLELPHLIRQLLLQEVYRGQRLTTGGNDKALAEAVAQARGMRHAQTLLRSLLYDEAWRLGIEPQQA
jgi:hypothetical protein